MRDEGQGRPFVWGHGLLFSMDQDDRAGVLIPQHIEGIRLVRYDARGHGCSAATRKSDDYRWSSLAEDMLAVLDATGAPSSVLGGASMGCATSLHAAVMAPERVEALVLVIPPTAWGGRRVQAAMYRAGARVVAVGGMGPFVTMGRAAPAPRILSGELAPVRDVALEAMEHLDRTVVPHILRGAASSDMPAKDALATLDIPTLVLAWEGDPGHPLATAEELLRLLPQAELHIATEPSDVRQWPSLITDFVRR